MGQQHELLAVERQLEIASKNLIEESLKTLHKENLFKGQVRTLTHFDGGKSNLDESNAVQLESTVSENIDYIKPAVSRYWDSVLQKEATNQEANGDIIIDGKEIAKNVPVSFLLGLETKLAGIRLVYAAAHTLPPGIKWDQDQNEREGVFTAEKVISFKEEKAPQFKIAYEATKEHPADVREVMITDKVGKYETTQTCGLWTPKEKAQRLANIDKLLAAVKTARTRANKQEVTVRSIGEDLFKFIDS